MERDQTIVKILEHSDKLIETATKLGVAYVGYNAVHHWSGALVGLLALRLSNSPNLAAGVAGVATLTGLGLMNLDLNKTLEAFKTQYPYGVYPPFPTGLEKVLNTV